MKKHLPNALSISRAVLALPIAILALNQEWVLAFWIFALAVATDLVDGSLARALGAETEFGKKWIDPFSDAAMTAGAMSGLVFQTQGLLNFWRWAFPMLLVGSILKWFKHQDAWPAIRRIAVRVSPDCYVGTVAILLNIYALKAFDWAWTGVVLTVPIIVILRWFKEHRRNSWHLGQL